MNDIMSHTLDEVSAGVSSRYSFYTNLLSAGERNVRLSVRLFFCTVEQTLATGCRVVSCTLTDISPK
jgi:hypothetical protein